MGVKMDGKLLADNLCSELKKKVNGNFYFNIITTGTEDSASKVYVRNKLKRCEEIGIIAQVINYPVLTEDDVKRTVNSGIPYIFQLPLAEGSIPIEQISRIAVNSDPRLDVDGFIHPFNIAFNSGVKPCTPAGIVYLLDSYGFLTPQRACIIGRSDIVGKPLAKMLTNKNLTVTLCHSKTIPLSLVNVINEADIIVSAVGQPGFLTEYDFFDSERISKKVLIDVGINRNANGKLCGDMDPHLYDLSFAYTPVPGGVGPMTVAMLMKNIVDYYV